jgi:hypothetical protein
MWSIHAFNEDGIAKFHMGLAITTTSEDSSSSVSRLDKRRADCIDSVSSPPSANIAFTAARSQCGKLFSARSRTMISASGYWISSRSLIWRVRLRLADSVPRGLDSTIKICFTCPPSFHTYVVCVDSISEAYYPQ